MIDLNVDLDQWENICKIVKKSLGPGNGELVLHCLDIRLKAPVAVTVKKP
jgi:hypothetical protein